jgi:hypothetical protein
LLLNHSPANIFKLGIPVGMVRPFQRLLVGLQAVTRL